MIQVTPNNVLRDRELPAIARSLNEIATRAVWAGEQDLADELFALEARLAEIRDRYELR